MASRTDQTREVCVVLPSKNQLDITVGIKCRGQEVIGQLSELLGIQDLHLFGLCLKKDDDDDYLFLDLENKISSYFPKVWRHHTMEEKIVLHLKVQYYIGYGRLILEEKVRSLYYADLKGRVLCSQCSGQEGQYFQLAAYALQADLGDWTEREAPYFKPHDYFPPWILTRLGCNYILRYTPALHRELRGMCVYDAVQLFIQEACRMGDVPVIFYHMSKMVSREQRHLFEFPWPSIDRINYQGRRFEIRADGLAGSELVLYTSSVLHSQHLLKHMSSIHRLHLKTNHKQLQHRAERTLYREVCVKEKSDTDTESEDELPALKARTLQAKAVEPVSKTGEMRETSGFSHKRTQLNSSLPVKGNTAASSVIEMCVDEPEEMFVDDPEDIIHMTELLEGVSVDGPLLMPLMPVSPWIGITMEMKQVLKRRACSVSLNSLWKTENLSQPFTSPDENGSEEQKAVI